MAKSSRRDGSRVQPDKAEVPDHAPPDDHASSDSEPVVRSEDARGRLWLALVIWAFVFGFLFIYVLIDLVISFFFRK
jgi:hypothetical protein